MKPSLRQRSPQQAKRLANEKTDSGLVIVRASRLLAGILLVVSVLVCAPSFLLFAFEFSMLGSWTFLQASAVSLGCIFILLVLRALCGWILGEDDQK